MPKHLRSDGRSRRRRETSALISETTALVSVVPLRPALAAIPAALEYLGGPSRSKFYADLLPSLEVVRFGNRTFVTVTSLDRLIEANRAAAPEVTAPTSRADVP
jgi:hypothetical protein